MAAERAQERDFPWQRADDLRRATHVRRDRENHLLDRRPLRPENPDGDFSPTGLHAGLPGLPQFYGTPLSRLRVQKPEFRLPNNRCKRCWRLRSSAFGPPKCGLRPRKN